MTLDISLQALNAVLRLLTAALILYHQILLEPDRPNYPNGRCRLRIALFALGVLLAYNGVDLLVRLLSGSTRLIPSALLLSLGLFAVEILRLERLMRHWLPERLQARIQRWLHIASCSNREARLASAMARRSAMAAVEVPAFTPPPPSVVGPALAALAMAGTRVIGPGEPPSAVADAIETTPPKAV